MALLHSPLHDRHVALGAKFAEFGGWEMPLEYVGVVAEHNAVRTDVGVFDVSHMGTLRVVGDGAAEFLNATLSNDLRRILPSQAQYTLCCDQETGGIVDDLIAYYLGDLVVTLVHNAANTGEVERRLRAAAPDGVEVVDEQHTFVKLAVQGPGSDRAMAAVKAPTTGHSFSPNGFGYMSFIDVDDDDNPVVMVGRTGYTGERGYELFVETNQADWVWDTLVGAGATPCGLGARDTLRLEMGYPLHGQDISVTTTPNQARLGWAVGWKKPAFWGRDAILAEKEAGPRMVLRGLVATGRGIPRPGMRVLLTRDLPVGEITSGTFSPTLRKGVALAMLNSQIEEGAEVTVDVRGRPEVFVVTRPPFVPSHVKDD